MNKPHIRPDQNNIFDSSLAEHQRAFENISLLKEALIEAGNLANNALRLGKKIFLCGNGGSAGDAQHIAAELTGRFLKDRRPLAGLALTTDTSALTCIANDYDFSQVFSRQLEGLGSRGDVLIGISTSGNSENVVAAVKKARELGIHSIGFLGKDGGTLADLVDIKLIAPSNTTARIQEMHIFLGHLLCELMENQLRNDGLI